MSDSSSETNAKSSGAKTQDGSPNEDPASPIDLTKGRAESEASALIALTNYGDPAANSQFDLTREPHPARLAKLAPTLDIDIDVASDFLKSCMTSTPRVTYGLGAKISPHGAVPG